MTVTLHDIRAAAEQVSGKILDTPCTPSKLLSELTGAEIVIKFENLQFTAAFKERGALVKLLSLAPEQRGRGVIAASAGNHAQGVAYHAQRLGIPAVIVMPKTTPNVKVEHTRAFGAEVILHGDTFDDARLFAQRLAAERDLVMVHPYDDEKIIAGQGTIALEMLAVHPELEILVVPIGGGGMISGMAVAAKGIKPAIKLYGVQTERFPSMRQAMQGEPIICGVSTIAEGIAVKHPGSLTMPIIRELVEDVLLVDEADIEEAVLLLLEVEKTVAEGAGAAGLAAVLRYPDLFRGRKVGLVLCGGNIDLLNLSSIIQRGLARSGRLVRLRVEIRDKPGALAEVTRILSDNDANIVEVYHNRTFSSLPLQSVETEFVLQTRGKNHLKRLTDALTAAGYQVR